MHKHVNAQILPKILEEFDLLEWPLLEENDLHSEHAVDEKENEEAADALHPVGNVEVVG